VARARTLDMGRGRVSLPRNMPKRLQPAQDGHPTFPLGEAPDLAPLRRLLAIAGPEASTLLSQLAADPAADRTRLLQGAAGPDLPALRLAAHGIVALAGTAGDQALADLARTLKTVASDEAPARGEATRLAQKLAIGTATLISLLATEAERLCRVPR
jgi:hypothetical protein